MIPPLLDFHLCGGKVPAAWISLSSLLYLDPDITGIGRNFASSAGDRFRNINASCVCFRDKHFVRKERSGHISGIRLHINRFSITSMEFNISCISFKIEFSGR